MPEIIPAIIAQDFAELKEKLAQVEGLVSWAHIDVMDGVFVVPLTWRTPEDLATVQTPLHLEAHLMIANPENAMDAWLDSPVKRLLLHYESTTPETLKALIKKTHEAGKEAGIVLKLATKLTALDEFLQGDSPKPDVVQLMSISKIGYHGHPFVRGTLGRARVLRAQYPDAVIESDGGITLDNAASLCKAGVNRLVVGSSIFKAENIPDVIERFSKIVSE